MADSISPGMQQFYEMKEQYKDCVLFFRMGDFYEMFDDDAHIAHKVLGIAITTRNKNAEKPIPLAGIPFHAKEKYLPMLVDAGYKVAIAEQVSDPKLKGIVKREVVRVVSPSTLNLEGENYEREDAAQNIIISIIKDKGKYGLSSIDLSTHVWKTSEFTHFEHLQTTLYKISPKEVILDKELFTDEKITELLQKKYGLTIFSHTTSLKAKDFLCKHFGVLNLEGFGIEKYQAGINAGAFLLDYLQKNQKTGFEFLSSISYDSASEYMELDEATIKNLDLVYNFATKSQTEGTLFGVLNKTKTTAGKRVLREAILHPLQSVIEISDRQELVEELLKNKMLLDAIREELKYVSDIDTILNRLALGRAVPRDLLQLKKSLESIVKVVEIINAQGSQKLQDIFKGKISE